MPRIKVGVTDGIIAAEKAGGAYSRAHYLIGAAAGGADSFWVPDHLNSMFPRALWNPKYCGVAKLLPSGDAYMEPWTMLGFTAARNRIGRLRNMTLGIGVTDTGRRNPAVTAQAAATLSILTKGRTILGVGPGEREGNEPYGVEWSKPVSRFEEALATIRALWNSKGRLVNRESPYFPLRNALFDLPPYRGEWPQIWIGAHGPRMLRATGRYGDGYFPAFLHSTQDYAHRLEIVRTAASDAGRDPMSITPAVFLPVVTGRSRNDVDEALQSHAMRAWLLTASDELFSRYGSQHPLGAGFSGAQDLVPHDMDEPTVLSLIEDIPAEMVRDTVLHGTPADVVDQAAQWRDCGVRHIVLAQMGFMQPSLAKGLASVAPYARICRLLKRL
ncbi:MAG: LLM class flavin-dependent oxidoreductase [Mycolicibacterium neoaurum]|uniref:LLM class flavin-dependent oxidoreductase n=1 Tax=Mycolicibacterium neoaurum TaxID=1795 RepID=UPI002FF45D2E